MLKTVFKAFVCRKLFNITINCGDSTTPANAEKIISQKRCLVRHLLGRLLGNTLCDICCLIFAVYADPTKVNFTLRELILPAFFRKSS